MNIRKRDTAPRYRRDGSESFLLVSPRTTDSTQLSVTLVEMEPGGFQRRHRHQPEQMYYILAGAGEMTVAGDTVAVGPGDCIFIQSAAEHGLRNVGDAYLKYLSAAAPSFTAAECEKLWPLKSLAAV